MIDRIFYSLIFPLLFVIKVKIIKINSYLLESLLVIVIAKEREREKKKKKK